MGLEKVVEEVLASGRERRDGILAEADEEAGRLIEAARAEVDAYRAERQSETWARIKRMREQELQSAELELRRAELAMHRELLDRVEAEARDRLAALPRSRAEPLLRSLLARHAMPDGKVLSSPKDEPLVRALTSQRYAGHVGCIGGVVLESADGTVREDRTFETILRERTEASLPAIAGALFGTAGAGGQVKGRP